MITKTTQLKEILKIGEDCSKCGNCCSHGTGFLSGDDLKNIAGMLNMSEEEVKQEYLEEVEHFNKILLRPKTQSKPYGRCIFLKDNLCKIHEVKPLQCKIGNCGSDELSAWFLLNCVLDVDDPEAIRQYKIYLESGGKEISGGRLQELVPDKDELKKIISFQKLKKVDNDGRKTD